MASVESWFGNEPRRSDSDWVLAQFLAPPKCKSWSTWTTTVEIGRSWSTSPGSVDLACDVSRMWLNRAVRTEEPNSEPQAHGGVFATTHWSVVLAAGKKNTPQSGEALEQLCRNYWYPLYAYIRRRGFNHEDAQDLTQAFFAHLLRKPFLDNVGPDASCFAKRSRTP